MAKPCFNCGCEGANLYGYLICDQCKSKLNLFSDETVRKHAFAYERSKNHSYRGEVCSRLAILEKTYIKKRIKLLDIQARLKRL